MGGPPDDPAEPDRARLARAMGIADVELLELAVPQQET
jgi:hypothetical protein